LAGDLSAAAGRAAQANETVKYFVFGHKPAFTYDYTNAGGGGVNSNPYNDDPSTEIAYSGLDANTTTANNNQALRNAFWKVIAQYGATYFSGQEPNFNSPYDRYYAWGWVQVYQNGTVSLTMTGFADKSYYLLPTGGLAGFGPPQPLTQYNVAVLQ
jgi:hypothetical protein